MPLARAICGGCWASEVTCVILEWQCNGDLYGMVFRAAEGSGAAERLTNRPAMLTVLSQQCGMAENS
jgi:hypothetical protein